MRRAIPSATIARENAALVFAAYRAGWLRLLRQYLPCVFMWLSQLKRKALHRIIWLAV